MPAAVEPLHVREALLFEQHAVRLVVAADVPHPDAVAELSLTNRKEALVNFNTSFKEIPGCYYT
jgi:hypothetical protein